MLLRQLVKAEGVGLMGEAEGVVAGAEGVAQERGMLDRGAGGRNMVVAWIPVKGVEGVGARG